MTTVQLQNGAARIPQEKLSLSGVNHFEVPGKKFIMTLQDPVYMALRSAAARRGVTLQGLIRAVIVPDWQTSHTVEMGGKVSQSPSAALSETWRNSLEHSSLPSTLGSDRAGSIASLRRSNVLDAVRGRSESSTGSFRKTSGKQALRK